MKKWSRPKTKTPEQMRALLKRWSKAEDSFYCDCPGNAEQQQNTRERMERTRKRVREDLHWYLADRVLICLPDDFEPWGQRPNDERGDDCSCSCLWFVSVGNELMSGDWGICCSLESPHCGKLTWEHQGCRQYEWDGVE